MKHSFTIDMHADTVLQIERRHKHHRCARNKIVGLKYGSPVVEWYFEACTLRFVRSERGYVVDEILPAIETGRRITTRRAGLTAPEAERQLKEFVK